MKRTVKTLITKSLELAGKDIDKLICPFIMYQPKVCKYSGSVVKTKI